MESLFNEIDNRLKVLNGEPEEEQDSKAFTLMLPLDVIESLQDIGTVLEMKRTEVARMILKHGADEIIKKYQMKFEKFGATFEDQYALETGEKTLPELLEKWEKEGKDK